MCMDSGIVTVFGAGILTAAMAAVFFLCGTFTLPSLNKCIYKSSHSSFFEMKTLKNITPQLCITRVNYITVAIFCQPSLFVILYNRYSLKLCMIYKRQRR